HPARISTAQRRIAASYRTVHRRLTCGAAGPASAVAIPPGCASPAGGAGVAMAGVMRKHLLALIVLAGCGGTSSDGTSSPLSVQCPASVPAWSPGTAYAAGDVVSYGGGDYQCLQPHTALSDWTPSAVPALWQPVTCASGGSGGGSSGSGGGHDGGCNGGGSSGGGG